MNRTVAVIGLGYVGLPVAVAFGTLGRTIGFDINLDRLKELRSGVDRTREVSSEGLKASRIVFTDSLDELRSANFYIVAVPTPVDEAHQPDLTPILGASVSVGKVLKKGDIVVYESTVYPGCTEEECAPILEKYSGLVCGKDFTLGYSPERINPGDKEHTFTTIRKIVSGQDAATLDVVAEVYGSVVKAGVYRASSIKVAEAAKVIENSQRDINIAFMNELSMIFDRMGIDTQEVLKAAGTKWNFLNFRPGLVGGHCIGVDPYYLTHKAEKLGYIPQVILAGRRINDNAGVWIAQQTVKAMIHQGHSILGSRVTILGLTFKENCPDIRNSKVIDIIKELVTYGIEVQVHDPLAFSDDAEREYGIRLTPWEALKPAQGIVVAVAHEEYAKLSSETLLALAPTRPVVIDVKGFLDTGLLEAKGARVWRM